MYASRFKEMRIDQVLNLTGACLSDRAVGPLAKGPSRMGPESRIRPRR